MIHPVCTEIQNNLLRHISPESKKFFSSFVDRENKELLKSSSIDQGTDEWLDLRKPLLTASNYSGAIGWSPYVTSKADLVNKICYVPFQGSAATKYGNRMESKACKQFEYEHREKVWRLVHVAKEKKETQIEYGGIKHDIPQHILDLPPNTRAADRDLLFIRNSGLHIHPVYKWLGASPDGIIVLFGKQVGLLEIKCPYRNKYPYPLLPQYYYGQLLGGCFVMNFPFQYFYVWSETKTSCERFDFDENIWVNEAFPKLAEFYFQHLLPELVVKHKKSKKNTKIKVY